MKLLLAFIILGLLFLPQSGIAEHSSNTHNHDGVTIINESLEIITANSGEVVFEVHGIVCSFCSIGVQKKLSKLSFIDPSKYTKGVRVEIEKQKVTIALKPGSTFDVGAAYESIQSGGYEPIRSVVTDKNGHITFYDAKGKQCTESC